MSSVIITDRNISSSVIITDRYIRSSVIITDRYIRSSGNRRKDLKPKGVKQLHNGNTLHLPHSIFTPFDQ